MLTAPLLLQIFGDNKTFSHEAKQLLESIVLQVGAALGEAAATEAAARPTPRLEREDVRRAVAQVAVGELIKYSTKAGNECPEVFGAMILGETIDEKDGIWREYVRALQKTQCPTLVLQLLEVEELFIAPHTPYRKHPRFWTLSLHAKQPPAVRQLVLTILLVATRANASDRLPSLPAEMWLHVFTFFSTHDAPPPLSSVHPDAVTFFAAALEFFLAEVMEAAGLALNDRLQTERTVVLPADVKKAIGGDEEMHKMFSRLPPAEAPRRPPTSQEPQELVTPREAATRLTERFYTEDSKEPPLSSEELARLVSTFESLKPLKVPPALLEVWSVTNGLGCDDVIALYGATDALSAERPFPLIGSLTVESGFEFLPIFGYSGDEPGIIAVICNPEDPDSYGHIVVVSDEGFTVYSATIETLLHELAVSDSILWQDPFSIQTGVMDVLHSKFDG